MGVRLTYGFGAIAYGIKDHGFAYFLLLFYGTVVGLEPALVGTALLIALIFDALSDPIVGYWSDNTRSRWGRRHPFMYAAAIPVARVTRCCGSRLTGMTGRCFFISLY